MDSQPLLNTTELSQWLNIKESTIRKWVCHGKIPFLKVGRCVRFCRKTVQKSLEFKDYQTSPSDDKGYNSGVR
jgi:excisionase family DNA binding protein